MPLIQRCIDMIRRRTQRALATKDARFRLALSCGFLISAVAVLDNGPGNAGFAQGWGGMPDIFGGGSSFFGAQPAEIPVVQPRSYRRASMVHQRRSIRVDRHLVEKTGSSRQVRALERRRHALSPPEARLEREHGAPMSLNRISMCVRTCDGFAFPVGAYHGDGDRASHEATCQSECPDARTVLYILPAGAASIADATDIHTGRSYSKLPYAFQYTTVLSEACSCHAKSGGRIASLLHDYTLRRGDAVMTERGFRVFHGAAHFPFGQKDFVALARTRDIRKSDRPLFRAIEKASLTSSSKLASAPVAMEHQASR